MARCSQFVCTLVVAALLLSTPGGAWADNKGGGNDNKGSGKNNQGGGGGKGQDKPKKNRPTPRVQGNYVIRIAGYYTGSGTARATSEGIKITARVKDPAGKSYSFQASSLNIVDDRFTGTGFLNDTEVRIDGRLDPRDKGNEVLKKGRMTFTFSVDGHHSRGAGSQN